MAVEPDSVGLAGCGQLLLFVGERRLGVTKGLGGLRAGILVVSKWGEHGRSPMVPVNPPSSGLLHHCVSLESSASAP